MQLVGASYVPKLKLPRPRASRVITWKPVGDHRFRLPSDSVPEGHSVCVAEYREHPVDHKWYHIEEGVPSGSTMPWPALCSEALPKQYTIEGAALLAFIEKSAI